MNSREGKVVTEPPSDPDARAILSLGISYRDLLSHLAPNLNLPPDVDDSNLARILFSILEPPRRKKLAAYNTITDAVNLIMKSKKIMVLSGAGISTSAGLPDFRSRDGIYVQIHAEYPDLRDPKLMFDIEYFRKNPKPFYKFAKALYPGQFEPTIGHKFIKCIESHGKLLRNYTQNIDTLERVAGIEQLVECHGSFAEATCTNCDHRVSGEEINSHIMNQEIPVCPKCSVKRYHEKGVLCVMKPNIVFFGEQLGDAFHKCLEEDKDQPDLLIVIGSSLKVRPVALIPRSIPSSVPQILINREPLEHMTFDIELLGDCDNIIQELCLILGHRWAEICESNKTRLTQIDGIPDRRCAKTKSSSSGAPQTCDREHGNTTRNTTNFSVIETVPVDHRQDDDHESDWEDLEVSDSEPGSPEQCRINLDIGEDTFYFLKPNRYLFPGTELTRNQFECYRKTSTSLNDE